MFSCCDLYSTLNKNIPKSWMVLFAAMKLKKHEIKQLYKIFSTVDFDHSGSVDIIELLTLLDLENTKFTERIFCVFDKDSSDQIDFKEFVVAAWNYCTLNSNNLDRFAFDLYDRDKSGKLSAHEVHQMLKEIYGKKLESNPRIKAIENDLEKIQHHEDIDLEHFIVFNKTHSAFLFPAFNLQLQLQKSVMGIAFWNHCAQRRIQISKGKYKSVADIVQMNLNNEMLEEVLFESQKIRQNSLRKKNIGESSHRPQHHNNSKDILPTASPTDECDALPSHNKNKPHGAHTNSKDKSRQSQRSNTNHHSNH